MKGLLCTYTTPRVAMLQAKQKTAPTNHSYKEALFPVGVVYHGLLIVVQSGVEKGHWLVCGGEGRRKIEGRAGIEKKEESGEGEEGGGGERDREERRAGRGRERDRGAEGRGGFTPLYKHDTMKLEKVSIAKEQLFQVPISQER
jgi:hypothetical protein